MATSGLVCVKDLGKAGIDYFEITGATKKEDKIKKGLTDNEISFEF